MYHCFKINSDKSYNNVGLTTALFSYLSVRCDKEMRMSCTASLSLQDSVNEHKQVTYINADVHLWAFANRRTHLHFIWEICPKLLHPTGGFVQKSNMATWLVTKILTFYHNISTSVI